MPVVINGQELPVVWAPSGALGVSFEPDVYWYERFWPWRKAARRLRQSDVLPTTKSLGLYPIRGNTPLQGNGETPQQLLPSSMVVDFRTATTLNAFGHSGFGVSHHLLQKTWDKIDRPWVLSVISDKLKWPEREKELLRICEAIAKHKFNWDPIFEVVFGCPSVDLELHEMFGDCPKVIKLFKENLPGYTVGANISPIAMARTFFEAEDAGADYLRLCNTIPHWFVPDVGCAGLPNNIPWKDHSPLVDRGYKAGGYSGPMCAEIILERLAELEIGTLVNIPVAFGNGFYTRELIRRGFELGGRVLSLGMAKLVRPWVVEELVDFAYSFHRQGR